LIVVVVGGGARFGSGGEQRRTRISSEKVLHQTSPQQQPNQPPNQTNSKQGKDAVAFLEGLVVGDIAGLADGTGSLSVFTNEKGGIIDDTVVTKVAPAEVYLVVNAGCRDKDLAHLNKHLAAAKVRWSGGAAAAAAVAARMRLWRAGGGCCKR
jgi:hypothetical protein